MRIAFAIENHLGHRTVLANLRTALEGAPDLDPIWIPIDAHGNGIIDRIPRVRDMHALVLALSANRALARTRRQGRFDVLFLHTQRMAHLLAPWMWKMPTFISIDGTPASLEQYVKLQGGNPKGAGSRYRRLRDGVHKFTYSLARGIVCMSRLVRETVTRDYGVPHERTLVLWPGVDLTAWHPPDMRDPGDDVRLLFVGGDFERKGGDLLLRWARETKTRGWKLDIVTGQPFEAPARVRYHPSTKPNDPSLRELVRQADLFVLPTRADLSPWVISEAKASGTAVLSTTVGALPELVRDGVDGWLVPSDNFDALSACLDRVLGDRARLAEFGARGRQDAEARLDARRNGSALIDFIRANR